MQCAWCAPCLISESTVVQEQQADLFGMRGVLYVIAASIALAGFCVVCEWMIAAHRDVQHSKDKSKVGECTFLLYK